MPGQFWFVLRFVVFALLVAGASLWAQTRGATAHQSSVSGAATTWAISITNSGFDPSSVTVKPGDGVTWINQTDAPQVLINGEPHRVLIPVVSSGAPHTSSAAALSYSETAATGQQTNAPLFPAQPLAPGQSFSFVFAAPGHFSFYVDGQPGNVGTVIVEAANASATATATPTATEMLTDTPTSTETATPSATGTASPTVTATPTITPIHDWSFNGDATDSVGTAVATLSGGASLNGCQLVLDGTSGYASLPIGSDLSTLSSATIEAWVTWNSSQRGWTRVFDFGSGTNAYMFFTPKDGYTGAPRFAITNTGAGGEQLLTASSLPNGPFFVAVTIDSASRVGKLYLNGSLAAENDSMTLSPADLGLTTQDYLGRSQYSPDPYLDGSIDEFRVYDVARSDAQIQADATNGPASCSGTFTATATPTTTATGTHATTATVTDTPTITGTPTDTGTATNTPTVTNTATITPAPTDPPVAPDPETVASPVDQSVATDPGSSTQFLYTGGDPIQTGVITGTIQQQRAAVLRGQVVDAQGTPLPAVLVTVLDHPEYGQTTTRADGGFELAVNGGGQLTVNYFKNGYVPAQRSLSVPWEDYVPVPEVALVAYDPQVTTIDLSNGPAVQVAAGSVVSDTDGTRQPELFVTQGTTATMTLPDGSTQTLNQLHIRITEFTVGANGHEAMPAELPADTGYTYAVDLSADEEINTQASKISFTQPLPYYVENFLGFPVGQVVPVGSYDRSKGEWVPEANGAVVQILSISGGMANLDLDGSGNPATATQYQQLGISDAERTELASRYSAGQSLWRIPISHFSAWDFNWPVGPPSDATPPNQPLPVPVNYPPLDDRCHQSGSDITCETQALGETLPIVGTAFSLHYQSDRQAGYTAGDSLKIPLSGASVPASLKRIDLKIQIAGQHLSLSFPASPNQSYTFTWDGKDGYGRPVQGPQQIAAKIGYVYPAVYLTPDQKSALAAQASVFGHFTYDGAPATGNTARTEITVWQNWQSTIGPWTDQGTGLGGWTIDVHHAYDPFRKVLYLGNGQQQTAQPSIGTVSGASATDGIAVGPDGSVYVVNMNFQMVEKINPDGTVTQYAGSGGYGYTGDGGPAWRATFRDPTGIALGPDGSLYIADQQNYVVRKVDPSGIITTVARGLFYPHGVGVGPDGSLYIADTGQDLVRRVDQNGVMTTIAGGGNGGDGGLASKAAIGGPTDVAVGPDGSIYIVESGYNRVRRIRTDGIITTVAGTGTQGDSGDGGLATHAELAGPVGIAISADGSLYITEGSNRVRRVGPDGIITTYAGTGLAGGAGDGGLATQAQLSNPRYVAVGPNGSLYVAENNNYSGRTRQVYPSAFPVLSTGNVIIPSEDGAEAYIFDKDGKHLQTLDSYTGAVLYQFGYDTAGHLSTITDGAGNVTTIAHDANGNPTTIVAPFGQTTTLSVDANGNLASVADSAGDTYRLTATSNGMLTTLTDPNGNVHHFSYDSLGRLVSDQDPAGGGKTLGETDISNGSVITVTTALGRTTTYQATQASGGSLQRTITAPSGLTVQQSTTSGGTTTTTFPDGTTTSTTLSADSRWGMLAPLFNPLSVNVPGLPTLTMTQANSATLANLSDPLSVTSLNDTVTINGVSYQSTYDAASRTMTLTSPDGRQFKLVADSQGRVIQQQVVGRDPISYTYDAHGRVATVTLASGADARVYRFAYDANGDLQSVTDPLQQVTSYRYDATDRLIGVTLPDTTTIGLAYDANGNRTGVTPPGQAQYTVTYDPMNLPTGFAAPDGTTTQFAYNADHELTTATLPDGQTVTLGYDGGGRLTRVATDQRAIGFSFGSTGTFSSITTTDGVSLTYSYSGSLVNTETLDGPVKGAVSRSYDSNLRTASYGVNGTGIGYRYDADGLLTGAGDLSLTRDAQDGQIAQTTLGTITTTASYNGLSELTGSTVTVGNTMLDDVQYSRDRLGRTVQQTETISGTQHVFAYSYDPNGRLIGVSEDGSPVASYGYDANGNRTSATVNGNPVSPITYDPTHPDQLIAYGDTTYTYNPNGQLTGKATSGVTTTYEYDALGNLLGVSLPGDVQVSYVLDGLDRRVGKKVNGTLTQGFLYQDDNQPIAELDGNNNVVSRFVYASRSNVPDYLIKNGTTYRIISDERGSPRLVVDTSTGQVIEQIDYDAFGNVLSDTNPGFQPFGFAGGLYDPDTQLVHFGVRDYDPTTGRWISQDPFQFTGGDTNAYSYVGNDPINQVDPQGTDGQTTGSTSKDSSLLHRIYDGAKKWLKNKFSKVCVGATCIHADKPEVDVGTSADLGVGDTTIVHVDATAGLGVTPCKDPTKPLFAWRFKVGAKVPALTKIPFVGKLFQRDLVDESGEVGNIADTPTGQTFMHPGMGNNGSNLLNDLVEGKYDK